MQSIQALANICVYKVFKKDVSRTTPAFKKIKIRKSLFAETSNDRVENPMLVMFDSFNAFFAILCSVVRKVLQRRKTVL